MQMFAKNAAVLLNKETQEDINNIANKKQAIIQEIKALKFFENIDLETKKHKVEQQLQDKLSLYINDLNKVAKDSTEKIKQKLQSVFDSKKDLKILFDNILVNENQKRLSFLGLVK